MAPYSLNCCLCQKYNSEGVWLLKPLMCDVRRFHTILANTGVNLETKAAFTEMSVLFSIPLKQHITQTHRVGYSSSHRPSISSFLLEPSITGSSAVCCCSVYQRGNDALNLHTVKSPVRIENIEGNGQKRKRPKTNSYEVNEVRNLRCRQMETFPYPLQH